MHGTKTLYNTLDWHWFENLTLKHFTLNLLNALSKQVALLKKRTKGVSDGAVPLEGGVPQSEDTDATSSTQSPLKEQGVELEGTEGKQIFYLFFGLELKAVFNLFLMNAFHFLGRRGQQWSNQTHGGFAEESEEAGKPAAEVQRSDANTQGEELPAGQWEWDPAGAAAGETAGAGEDEGA